MSPSRGSLDPHQFRNARQSLDSRTQLFHDTSNSNPQPPDHAALMDTTRFDDFSFPFATPPNQPPLLPLTDQTNVTQPTDTFTRHPSTTAMDHTARPVRARGVTFATPPSDRPRDLSDAAQDRHSPMANSLEDSVPDEFGLASHRRVDGTDLGGKAKEDKADAAPAWSELKTKAGKERKRLPLACIACRRKKIRCSGEKPACKHCLRSRIPCVYKVTTRKAAPRTDYMAMLDKRLKRMEERIIKVIPKSEQDTTASVTRAVVKPPVPGAPPATKGGSKKRGADEAFGPDLKAWARAPSKSKIVGDDRPNSLQVQEEEENKLLHEGSESLPPKDVQEHLAEVFFDSVYGQSYHLLHKPSYMRKLKNNTLPPVLILSVCAVAARFSTNPQLNSSTPQFLRGEEWASQARDICMRRYEWPNLTILTCLLILGLHEFGTCQGGRSWALGGQAIRMAFALQLHRDLDHDPTGRTGKKTPLSFIDREIRRRIMWACFLMDRFNSSGTDRPMFIREETIQIPLPIRERYFQLDMPAPTETLDGQVPHPASPNDGQLADARENMGVAAFMIQTIALWGQIVNYLNQGGKEMDAHPMWDPESHYSKLLDNVENFNSTLNPSMRYSSNNVEVHKTENTAAQFFFMHICIQHNILFLNCAALNASQKVRSSEGPPKEFFTETSAKMVAAANRISDMLKEAERLRQFVSAPFAGYCAFSSTSVHIAGLISRNPSMKPTAEANLTTNVKYLHKMKKYWGMFHWMVEEVRSQYRKSLDTALNGSAINDATVQTSILQYGDWFNRYPHGVSDAEFMDPAIYKKKDQGADGVLEANPELQSVEEFMSTLSPSQNSEARDGARGSTAKRKSTSKKQINTNVQRGQQQLESMSNPELGGQTSSDQLGVGPQQQRRFSGAVSGQTSGPTAFSPLTVPHSQASFNSTISPMSPANVGFPHHAHVPPFFAPDLLAMNLGQQTNSSLQPLERQLLYGGYSMDSADNMATGPNMMDGVDWDSMAAGAQTARGPQGRRSSVKGGIDGQVSGPVDANADFDGQEASSAWFMPFNLEPPEMSQDMGLGVSNVDPFAGMFNGGGSGLTTPNPLNGLHGR